MVVIVDSAEETPESQRRQREMNHNHVASRVRNYQHIFKITNTRLGRGSP